VTAFCIAEGLGFTEGPLWRSDGRLVVASVSRGMLYELLPDGKPRGLAETGGNPTGLAGGDGLIWVAQGGSHSRTSSARATAPGIQVVDATEVRDIVTTGLNAPNDCAFGPDGRLWFTDPVGPAFESRGRPGRVCALDLNAGSFEVIAEGMRFPNGLAFDRNGTSLYVAETGSSRILRLEVDRRSPPELWADLRGAHPDGLALDADGRVYAAAPRDDCVVVVGSDGTPVDRIPLPRESFPTNVCFGGRANSVLYVTAVKGGRVYAIETATCGAPLFPPPVEHPPESLEMERDPLGADGGSPVLPSAVHAPEHVPQVARTLNIGVDETRDA
jgi:gluconolactonase